MSDLEKLKRQMLREVVRENLETLDGRLSLRRRFGGRRARMLLRAAFVIVVPLLVFASINAISFGGGGKPEVIVVSAAPSGQALPPVSTPASLPAPRAIDANVFQLAVGTVVIDAGHGGGDPGASVSGLKEKDVTLDIARHLKRLLEERTFRVVMTREGDEALSLKDRARIANESHADLFVSIHVNSIPREGMGGIETYYLGAADDPQAHRLAGAENQESGYSLADFRKLLEGVYAGVRQNESRAFATAVQGGLVTRLRKANPELRSRGVKSAPFVVLIATEMPGILAEVSSITNENEARLLRDPDHRLSIASALRDSIESYVGSRNKTDAPALARAGDGD